MNGHHIVPLFKTGFKVCARCGLVVFKNDVGIKSLNKICPHEIKGK